jgi:hypothetical protein
MSRQEKVIYRLFGLWKNQLAWLKRESQRRRVSMAQVLRDVVSDAMAAKEAVAK